VTKDEGAVIIVDNIDTKRNKAEHKIIQLNKEAKIYLVSFGKYELDGLVWDSLIKGFQMRVNQPIATFKECILRFEEYLRSLKDNYRKDLYIQRIIWTVLNKAEHKINQLNKEAKIYLVSFGKYELDGLVWDSLIKGFQMRVNQPIATFKECILRFEEYLRSLKDNYRKDLYIQRIIWTVLNNLTINGGIQSLVENINRIYSTLSIDRQVNEEATPILINELVNFLNQN